METKITGHDARCNICPAPLETFLRVRNEHAAIRCAFHGAKDSSPSRNTGKTDVKEAFEWATCLAVNPGSLGQAILSISFFDTFETFI